VNVDNCTREETCSPPDLLPSTTPPREGVLSTSQDPIARKIAIRGDLPGGEAPCSWRSRRPICRTPFLALSNEGVVRFSTRSSWTRRSSARSSPGSPLAGTPRESKPDVHFSTAQKRKIRITNRVLESSYSSSRVPWKKKEEGPSRSGIYR